LQRVFAEPYHFVVNFLRPLLPLGLVLAVASCATFHDDSHYVSVSPADGYYILEKDSPLASKMGYTDARTWVSDEDADSYTDIVAFRFNSAGVLSAPPGYFTEIGPGSVALAQLATLKQGVTTWPEIQKLFHDHNRLIKQADGGMLVYHEIRKNS
jgi:hypothetical protein